MMLLVLSPLAQCTGQVSVESTLNQLLLQLEAVQKERTVENYVRLDSSLRAFVADMHRTLPYRQAQFWKDQYSQLGLFIGHYSDEFGYSEKFLVDAHSLDPTSPFRQYTLYSTVMGVRTFHGLGEMPQLDSAFQYVREFPTGPFSKNVYLIIAGFYKDLYMVLRDGKEGSAQYKYECFESYIDKSRIGEQRDRTQALAISYYEKVLKMDPTNAFVLEILPEVRAGTVTAWSYCAD